MAFVTATANRDNPLERIGDGMFLVSVEKVEEVENPNYGKLFRPDLPEGKDNRKNPYKTQYRVYLKFENEVDPENPDEPLVSSVWLNPTAGEKSKFRKVAKALGVWDEQRGGADTDDFVGNYMNVVVTEGKIKEFVKARK